MGRPRKDQAGPSAVERMREAFWELLEERPYQSITVRLITQRAGVNPNTFYYHFENIDDMAVQFFEDNIPTRLIDLMVEVSMGKPIDVQVIASEPDIEKHYQRVRAVVRSGSMDFAKQGRERLIKHWMERAGLLEGDLSRSDRARVNYLWGGVTAVISSDDAATVEDYLELLQTGIVDAVIELVRRIGVDHGMSLEQRGEGETRNAAQRDGIGMRASL